MAQTERLQPALLDRLTDDDPGARQESREARVLSFQRLRQAVVRDLGWLLNTVQLSATDDIASYPEVLRSVVNYGMADLSGRTASGVTTEDIEEWLREAIETFEPRILPSTLRIEVSVREGEMSHNLMSIRIEGELWAQPLPQRLFLKTEFDLETGTVQVQETGGQGAR